MKRVGVGVSKGDEDGVAVRCAPSAGQEGVSSGSVLILCDVCGVCSPEKTAAFLLSLFHGRIRLVEGVVISLVLGVLCGVSTVFMIWFSSVSNASSLASRAYSSFSSTSVIRRRFRVESTSPEPLYGDARFDGVSESTGKGSVRELSARAATSLG